MGQNFGGEDWIWDAVSYISLYLIQRSQTFDFLCIGASDLSIAQNDWHPKIDDSNINMTYTKLVFYFWSMAPTKTTSSILLAPSGWCKLCFPHPPLQHPSRSVPKKPQRSAQGQCQLSNPFLQGRFGKGNQQMKVDTDFQKYIICCKYGLVYSVLVYLIPCIHSWIRPSEFGIRKMPCC